MRKNGTGLQILGKAHDLYSSSRALARNGAARANTFIHESPLLSAFLGVGAGFLIGMWARRRD